MNTEFVEKVDGGWRGKVTGRLYVAPRECEQPAEVEPADVGDKTGWFGRLLRTLFGWLGS